ncbi:hypothetical protein [Mangrovicoccus ximenensis]|uniref:hypothetical protein n=1 Tax=Mangrovicoccus ximenensis TaxID=1911570 RepID=UPI001374B57C|nr:hypothetical protein [Mangrovicoccus ximenensis]
MIVARLAGMPPEVRADYVERLKRFGTYRGGRPHDGARKWDGHDRPPHPRD